MQKILQQILSIFLPLVFCSACAPADAENGIDTILLTNGAIYTVNEAQPWAEAIFVEDGVIRFVGTSTEADEFADATTKIIDLGGKMVLPGLHDVHTHPLEARSPFAGTCLLDPQETDAENFIALLEECAPDQIGTNWVLGFGHSVFTLLKSQRNPIEILDEAIPDRPAVIMEATSHSIWVNSKGLEAAGINADTVNPPGGVIVKDDATGQPTGILFDSAGDLIMDIAWQPSDEIKELNYAGLLEALGELNKNGITSTCEARTYWKRDFQDAWLRAEREEKLSVRTILGLWAYPSMDDETQLAELKKLYRNNPGELLRISQIKVYADGILINSTAAMHEPYLETLGEIPSNNGLNYFTQERLTRYITALDAAGFDFHIHAIGDRGIHEALNAIEAGQSGNQRHRLTHLEVVDPADYGRFKALNVAADMQVSGAFTLPDSWYENAFLIGDRSAPLVPLKDLYEAEALVTLSSDWDVSTLNPFVGMQNALTRAPQNLPDLKSVIEAYTINPAYVMQQEEVVGSLEVGKEADLIVISQNIFDVAIEQIGKTQVEMTMLAGEIVYER